MSTPDETSEENVDAEDEDDLWAPEPTEVVDEVRTLIMGAVEPTSWRASPQGPAIFTVGNRLVVRQTSDAHAEIFSLLKSLGLLPSAKGTPGAVSGGMF